jgi:alpha-tubulin suppressor-like RCC1 family protein
MINQSKQAKDTLKVDPMIVSNKYHELSSDFNEILKEQFSNKSIINDFSPFLSNDVLILESTKTSIIILLKNGIVLSIGEESPTLGRRIVDINDKLKPNKIIFKRQVLDISCGRDHCLAKTDEFRIFSWGNNFYGQLGIVNFPMTWESNKDEPTELMFFAQKKSLQIKAGQYNSFSIDDENNIYGWGSNEYGQLLVDSDNKKISSPLLLNIKENFEDMIVLTNKKSKYFYILESKF